jgi:uncharacterized protein YfiM (DUF2279 family)
VAVTPVPVLLAISLALPGPKPPHDRWFGEDKLSHFFASFVVTSISASAARTAGLEPASSMWVGAGAGAGAGAMKEIYDLRSTRGTASLRDVAWDVVGIVAGALVARQVQ